MIDCTATPYDIAWTQNLVESINIGGVWMIPKNSSVWQRTGVSTVCQIVGDPTDETNLQVVVVMGVIGWSVGESKDDFKKDEESR